MQLCVWKVTTMLGWTFSTQWSTQNGEKAQFRRGWSDGKKRKKAPARKRIPISWKHLFFSSFRRFLFGMTREKGKQGRLRNTWKMRQTWMCISCIRKGRNSSHLKSYSTQLMAKKKHEKHLLEVVYIWTGRCRRHCTFRHEHLMNYESTCCAQALSQLPGIATCIHYRHKKGFMCGTNFHDTPAKITVISTSKLKIFYRTRNLLRLRHTGQYRKQLIASN